MKLTILTVTVDVLSFDRRSVEDGDFSVETRETVWATGEDGSLWWCCPAVDKLWTREDRLPPLEMNP